MTSEIRAFQATIPAGTAIASPTTFDMSFPDRLVTLINVLVPPGANGNVGFQMANAGVPIIPYNTGAFLVGNGEVMPLPVTGGITSGSWQLIGYNVGQFPHTLYVRFYLTIIEAAPSAPGTSVADIADLSAPPGGPGAVAEPVTTPAAPPPTFPIITNPPPSGPFVGPPPAVPPSLLAVAP